MDHSIWKKYSETFGARFTGRQKANFRKEIIEDFKALGMNSEIVEGRRYLTKARNVVIGNLKRAKTVIAIPYDTPQKVYWPKSYFFPLDGMATSNKTLVPVFGPVLILYIVLLVFMYGVEGFVEGGSAIQGAMALIIVLIILMFYLMLHGISNKRNFTRNSASVYAAYQIAKALQPDQRRNVVFLFVDCNKTKHFGAKIAAEDFLKQSKNPNVIVLNCFAKGSRMQIGYNPQNKKLAQDLNKALANNQRLKTIALSNEMRSASPMEHFAKAVTIGAGELDKKNRLCVMGTGKNSDNSVEEENIERVITMVTSYLNA